MSSLFEKSSVERLNARVGSRGDSRPRVLHFITNFNIGGTERQCIELLNRLDENRFDVKLAVLSRRGPLLEKILPRFPEILEFPLSSFYDANAFHQLRRFCRFLKIERISILHAHDFYSGLLGAIAARLTGIPVIAAQRRLTISNLARHEFGQRLIHKLANKILVNSEAIHAHIRKESSASEHKIIVIRNGLNVVPNVQEVRKKQRDFLMEELKLRDDVVIIGSVARLHSVKGHFDLLEAAVRVIASDDKVHFVLVGDGPLRDELTNRIERLGIVDHVHMLGDRDDSSEIVAGFDLSILSSLHEGLPNSVMEAMAMAVPVVATAVGGTLELVKNFDTGFLVQPGNVEALAERILYALSRREETKMIGMRGRRFILDQFNIRRMVESVENLYEEMLKK